MIGVDENGNRVDNSQFQDYWRVEDMLEPAVFMKYMNGKFFKKKSI